MVGAGVFGAWTAYQLRRAGHDVTLLDQYGPANNRASSGGESRIIRAIYGPNAVYTRTAARSLGTWRDFFARIGRPLLIKTGVLWLDREDSAYVEQSCIALRDAGVGFERLSATQLERRYPQIHIDGRMIALFEPEGGALMARQAVQAVVEQFVKDGGVYRRAFVETRGGSGQLAAVHTSSGDVEADAFVFACGPWLAKVFPDVLGERIVPTRQEVLFFGVPQGDERFEPAHLPIWIDYGEARGMYGFPDLDGRGFKLAFDLHGPEFDPDCGSRIVSKESIEAARSYLAMRFPALKDAPVVETRVCQYENTQNLDFIIDRHPAFDNVWIAGGGSGHGFKHGPAVGEYVAARVLGEQTPRIEERFSLASKQAIREDALARSL